MQAGINREDSFIEHGRLHYLVISSEWEIASNELILFTLTYGEKYVFYYNI